MKKVVAGIIIALIGCVSVPTWVDAQQRDGGRGRSRGRGIAEQPYQRRAYRGRNQRRRYYGGQWQWEDWAGQAAGTAVGTFFGNLLRGGQRDEAEEASEERETDEATIEPWTPGWVAYCKRKYKSFDIKDGRYLSYDGNRYFCK